MDRALLRFFQATADGLHAWTGKNNFWWCYRLVLVGFGFGLGATFTLQGWIWRTVCLCTETGQALSFLRLTRSTQLRTKEYAVNPEQLPPANYFRYFMLVTVLSPALFLGNLRDRLWFMDRLAMTCWAYFLACQPRRPRRSKLKQALAKLQGWLHPVPSPARAG